MFFIISRIWKRLYFERLARLLVRHALLLLVIAVGLTVISLWGATHLRIDSDYMAFVPDEFPGVVNLKKVIKKTGGFGNFMIVLEGSTPEVRRQFAQHFTEQARKFPWVDYVEYKKGWEKIEKNKLLYVSLEDIEKIHERLRRTLDFRKNPLTLSFFEEDEKNPLTFDLSDIERKYQRTSFGTPYFEDPDQQYTVAIVWPSGSMTNLDLARKAYADLSGLLKLLDPSAIDPNLRATIGGEYRNKIDEYESLQHDVLGSALIALGGISLLLFLFYRRKTAIIFVLLPLILGIVWSFGLAWVLVGRLNLLTVFLIAILFGLGVDYGIYLFSRYTEERLRGKSLENTIATVLYDTGRATMGAALTTALAFLTLVFMGFKGFQEFGLLAFCGVLIVFGTFFIFSPVTWVLGEKWKIIRVRKMRNPRSWVWSMPVSSRFIVAGFLIAIMGLATLPFVDFESDYGNLRSRRSAYHTVSSKIHSVFPLSKTPAVVLTDTLDEAKAVVSTVKAKIPQSQTIDTVKSLLDFLPEQINEKKRRLNEIHHLLVNNLQFMTAEEKKTADRYIPYLNPSQIKLDDLPKGLMRYFTGLPGTPGYMVFIYDKVRLSDTANALQYADDIREIRTPAKTYYSAEGSLIFADALDLMKKNAQIAFWVMIVGVLTVLAWTFWSLRRALVVFVPLFVSLLMTFSVMFLFHIKLNIFNLVIFPILIGIGIDSSLHLYHRFLESPEKTAIRDMIRFTGNSLFLATITTMIGFGSMLFSDHQGLRSIGLVAVIGMASQLTVSLLFFPSFLKWRMEKRKMVEDYLPKVEPLEPVEVVD